MDDLFEGVGDLFGDLRLPIVVGCTLILAVCACIAFFMLQVGGALPDFGEDTAAEIPDNAVVVTAYANAGVMPWLEVMAAEYNRQQRETSPDRPGYVRLVAKEAGEAVVELARAPESASVWVPDGEVWIEVLGQYAEGNVAEWRCQSTATSPVVLAVWRPIAHALGWPGESLGWLDMGSLATDANAWSYYSGGRFGERMRLGHAHPGLSATGANTLLAIAHAATFRGQGLQAEDVTMPAVKASIETFESGVSWFSSDPETLGRTMRERGMEYLSAAVVYESTVARYGAGEPEIVAVYPFEGTFVATHPYCISAAVPAEVQTVATQFRDLLLSEDGQATAASYGLRSVTGDAPVPERFGISMDEPENVLPPSSAGAIDAVQEVWQSARKPVNVVMLLDTSGSMEGSDKIGRVREAAADFVTQMGGEDRITIIAFSGNPYVLVEPQQVGADRSGITSRIRSIEAEGDTSLYDAIGQGADVIEETASSDLSEVMIVLTDGQDTASSRYSDFDAAERIQELVNRYDATVFTIAYGEDADQDVLSKFAVVGRGNFYQGSTADIAAIYAEMSAAFGGSAGIGR